MKVATTDLWLFAVLITLVNLPLLGGDVCEALLFVPACVADGQWWRVLSGPFVHVSGYHLMLDAAAFLLLYHGLRERSAAKRVLTVAACAAGSLAFALPALGSYGSLCGLSGVAHGLMAASALEMLGAQDRALTRAGAACLLAVVAKSAIEAASGRVLFESLHVGDVAQPIASCHLGGVVGGLGACAAFAVLDRLTRWNRGVTCTPALMHNGINNAR